MTDSQVGTKDAALQHEWYRAVAKVFARTRKQDPSDVPDDVWKKLIKPTYDGIDVKPLYMRTDQGPEPSAPGEFPYTRGLSSLRPTMPDGEFARFSDLPSKLTQLPVARARKTSTSEFFTH